MAAASAVLQSLLRPGDVLVAPSDAYSLVARRRARARRAARRRACGSSLRTTTRSAAAMDGATLVWVETPSNPELAVLDIARARRRRARGGRAAGRRRDAGDAAGPAGARARRRPVGRQRLEGDDRPLRPRPRPCRRPRRRRSSAPCAAWRDRDRRDPRPVRGLARAPLARDARRAARAPVRERAGARRGARRRRARARRPLPGPARPPRPRGRRAADGRRFGGVRRVRAARRAARRSGSSPRAKLVAEATSFGGVHTTAERRARWGTDDVPEGFIRMSAGLEDERRPRRRRPLGAIDDASSSRTT